MVKSTIKLENGTLITVEGTVEEVAKLISIYGSHGSVQTTKENKNAPKHDVDDGDKMDTIALVNATKDSEYYEGIEKHILDKAGQVDRVLLPLFIAEIKFGADAALTSNDVYKFLKEFGINMALPNISKTLSGPAKNYVMSNSVRKKGTACSYRLSRKGKQHIEQILAK